MPGPCRMLPGKEQQKQCVKTVGYGRFSVVKGQKELGQARGSQKGDGKETDRANFCRVSNFTPMSSLEAELEKGFQINCFC